MGERRRRAPSGDAMSGTDAERPSGHRIAADSMERAVDELWRLVLRDAAVKVCEMRRGRLPGPDPASSVTAVHELIERSWMSAARKARECWDLWGPDERFAAYSELYEIAANMAIGSIAAVLELANLLESADKKRRAQTDGPPSGIARDA